ncbi:transposase [Paraneptunicella aestuarii]|uniref:transposase n=1 Tax=Paraneptunicella aestuarii TaxID=2831148 RepID=UPI0038CD3650|nr:transposase [Paraneptunicella aestuarii]
MEQHLGYSKNEPTGKNACNSCTGRFSKSVRSVHSEIALEVPRDRKSSFELLLVKNS